MKPITRQMKQNITMQLQQKVPVKQIAKNFSVSIGTVSNIKASIQDSILTIKPGRPQKLSNYSRHYLRRQIISGKIDNAVQGQRLLKQYFNLDINVQTV